MEKTLNSNDECVLTSDIDNNNFAISLHRRMVEMDDRIVSMMNASNQVIY
jgi:hypothetical protein